MKRFRNITKTIYFDLLNLIKTKVLKGGKGKFIYNYLRYKVCFLLIILLPQKKEAIVTYLSNLKANKFIIQNKIGKFLIYGNNDSISKSSIYFEKDIQNRVEDYGQNGIFLDIGANIGFYSILALNSGYKEVHAFEINEEIFDLLKKNIKLNLGDNNIHLYNSGLGDKSGSVIFQSNKVHTGGSKIVEKKSHKHRFDYKSHEIITGDERLKTTGVDPQEIDLIKIDVEGYEYKVLLGMKQLLHSLNPGTKLFIEILPHSVDADKTLNIIQNNNFSLLEKKSANHLFKKIK